MWCREVSPFACIARTSNRHRFCRLHRIYTVNHKKTWQYIWNCLSATFNHTSCTKDHCCRKFIFMTTTINYRYWAVAFTSKKCLDYITGVQLSRLRLQWFQCKHKQFVRDAEDKIHLGLIADADEVGSHQQTFLTRRTLIHFIRRIRHIVAVFVVVLPVRLARETWNMSQQNQVGNVRLLLPQIALRCMSNSTYCSTFYAGLSTIYCQESEIFYCFITQRLVVSRQWSRNRWYYQRYWILRSIVISYFFIFNLSIYNLHFTVAIPVAKIALFITSHFYFFIFMFLWSFSLF